MKRQIEIITLPIYPTKSNRHPSSLIKVKKGIQLLQFMSVVIDWFSFG